ncbi:MAG TPA: TetR/AcrR family transcriptional regulator [Pseudonocardiaceae bacterium]|jgi:AcrR family transcriptional regulator|nr:TetR/AcrR family transcriptional regulator [Pseudonocardiaceae bacterium]
MTASSLRARVRTEMIEEIKAVARARLATDGANLSLRGVARDLGVVASALYRYFPSRDDLLTALITEAYEALGAAATTAAAAPGRPGERWLAICHAVRDWALAHPAEYGLLYGSPVPGYAAPPTTIAPAATVIMLLVGIVLEADDQPGLPLPVPLPAPVAADLRRLIAAQGRGTMPEELLNRVFVGWTHLFGLVSFEVFGRLTDMVDARRDYFEHHMTLMAGLAGLPLT